jgi:hypothetical protein
MRDTASFLAFLSREAGILSHLVSKLQPAHLEFRLTPGQRSTGELVSYLAIQWVGGVQHALTNSWDHWDAWDKTLGPVTPANFAAALERNLAEIRRLLAGIDLANTTGYDTKGNALPLDTALLHTVIEWTAAYKMQLFLQAKAAGLGELASSNLWWGTDKKPAG